MEFIFCSLILCLIEYEKKGDLNKIKQILSNISYGITSESIDVISVSQLALFVFIYWIPFLTNKIYILKPEKSLKFFYNQIEIPTIFKRNIAFQNKFNQFIKQNDEGVYEYSQFVLAKSITYMLLHLIDPSIANNIIGNIDKEEQDEIDRKYQDFCNKLTNNEYKGKKIVKKDIEDDGDDIEDQ
jgi:hypothetical protein